MKTDITAISENIVEFFEKTTLRDHIKKTWLYNENCFVIDFEYKGVKFALDFTASQPASQPALNVDLVLRNHLSYFTIKGNSKKECISSGVHLMDALTSSLEKSMSMLNDIDSLFEYDVSVIIPIHNRESLIPECIKSINSQTLSKDNFEVIFVDDGSTDKSVAAIEYLIDPDINYHIIRREVPSGNASTPRNEGIKSAKGRYTFFMDSDDFIDESLLENGLNFADKNNSDVVYFKIASSNGRNAPKRAYKINIVENADITKNHLFRSMAVFKLFRTSLLRENNILFNPSISVGEDKVFMVQVLSVAERVSILADKDYYYITKHDNGHLSGRKFPIEDKYYILSSTLGFIYFCNRKSDVKAKLYNAWLIICLEWLSKACSSKGVSESKKRSFFSELSIIFGAHAELVDKDMIYAKERCLLNPFLRNDYSSFISAIEMSRIS